METKINLIIEDTDGKEIFRKDNFALSSIPRVGEAFDFVMKDQSFYEENFNEQAIKGRTRVADVTHVYMEYDKSYSVNITLGFENDERFKKMFGQ